jgi:hypothetical protein
MMLRLTPHVVALGLLFTAQRAAAQSQVRDDSVGIMVNFQSRLLWRDITLSDAPGLQSGIAIPLSKLRLPLQLELRGWTALDNTPSARFGDQYSAALHYQQVLEDRPHPKSIVIGYTEYWNPNVRNPTPPLRRNTRETSVTGLFDYGIAEQGIRTIHVRFDVVNDLAREKSTWIQSAASASIGTAIQRGDSFYSLSAILRAALSASDFQGPRMPIPRPDFGFHSADFGIDLELRSQLPFGDIDATSTLQFGTSLRAERLGPDVGWVGLQLALLFL